MIKELLDTYYKMELHLDKFHDRKLYIEEGKSYQINGVTQSGKTKLVKNYLLTLKKNSYLYIDCNDVRLNIDELNNTLATYCLENRVYTLVLDNYNPNIEFVNVSQLIIVSQEHYEIEFLDTLMVYPLDYEEFLAYEHKYDSTALNHFVTLGGFAHMHKLHADTRNIYIQTMLKNALDEMEFDILIFCAKMNAQKLSAFMIYERLKVIRKISKDKLYQSYENLLEKNYIHALQKFEKPKATKKIYLCDIALKHALSLDKSFSRLFENMVYLELLKSGIECFYDDGVDFYIPSNDEIILCKPFSNEHALFKKLQKIEAFIFTHQIKKITAITMNIQENISYPFSKVQMLPFDIWVLGD